MAGVNMKLKALLAADAASKAVAALTGDDVVLIDRTSSMTWQPLIDQLEEVAGGFPGTSGVHVGDSISFDVKAAIRPLVVTSAMTERPSLHALLLACGFEVSTWDEAQITDKDVGDGDGSTNSFNITLNGGDPVVDGSVTIKATVGGVEKEITWDASGVVSGDGTGTIDHNAGTLSTVAFTAGAPDSGTDLTATFQKAEQVVENIGTGDGTTTPSVSGLDRANVNRGSVSIACDAQTGTDDNSSNLDQGDLATGGTLTYASGVMAGTLTWDSNTTNSEPIIATYNAKVRGPYNIIYTLKPTGHGEASVRFYAVKSGGGGGRIGEASNVRGTGVIVATRRKHVMLEAALQGVFSRWANVTSLPTWATTSQRGKIAHFKADTTINVSKVIVQDEDTGEDATAALGTGPYTGTLPRTAKAGSLRIFLESGSEEVFTDPTQTGVLVGSDGGTGTYDYVTQAWSITLGSAPAVSINILADYHHDEAFSGTMLDVKAPMDAFDVTPEETANGTGGFDEISLDAKQPSAELQVRLADDGDFDPRAIATSQAAIDSKTEWKDPSDKANRVVMEMVHVVGNEGITIGDEARAPVTFRGPLLWGQPGDVGVDGSDYGTNPNKDGFRLRFRTDPALQA